MPVRELRRLSFAWFPLLACALTPISPAQDRHAGPAPPEFADQQFGPYDVHVLAGGPGVTKPLPENSPYLSASVPYTLLLWVEMGPDTPPDTLLAGLGDPAQPSSRFLGLSAGRPMLRYGTRNGLVANTPLARSGWHLLAATFDGSTQHLFVDSIEAAHGTLADARVAPRIAIAPTDKTHPELFQHFGGNLAQITLLPRALDAAAIAGAAAHPPDVTLVRYEEASPAWPVQTKGQAGYAEPQEASVMPHSRAPLPNTPVRAVPVRAGPALVGAGPDSWVLANGWSLASAVDVTADPHALSTAGFSEQTHPWLAATVPGTVLTTMVDRGVYPDPDFGLNNLAIPESLNKHDYWYRIEFDTPHTAGRRLTLTFNGINYAAEAWLNGQRLGDITGAFIRGTFDISALLARTGRNALAVRVSPPPHPGIPQEQSILAGPGENGGIMCLDGPTFVATEGWDWIPAIRDRNTGIWQDVVLTASGALTLGDPQVITHLPLPDTSSADIAIAVPVANNSARALPATLTASFEGVTVTRRVTLKPGQTSVTLRSTEFPQLHLINPRLWWPNGYGRPELYHLKLSLASGRVPSDQKTLTFGIREITYELSAFDSSGRLRRVEYDPAASRLVALNTASALPLLIDVSHSGLRRTAEYWAPSLTSAGEHSPAVATLPNPHELTDLVLKVNGVRIAARGGNWGMDDSRKRVSREHLEPYFRLHREAGLNIIRNWVGQDTEEAFYQLADEYGMMVWNDFWASTQDYNVEPQDVPLFLANARDVVRRFRNHPSIVLWCGRNEGIPQPILNDGLIALFHDEDGTRYYTPGSNRIDLRNSGPYKYQEPSLYYTTLDRGFSVELGIPSLSTLESLKSSIAPADLWPISDAWAYHDWHASGNGDTHPLVDAMERQLGSSTTLEDFERKAQIFNYVDHRAIFEGFNQHLWTPNSGRMLWMTQPAWPSNMWQIFSSDYDTNASYYGVKKACEPLHIQLDLSDYTLAAVNTTNAPAPGMHVTATVYSLDNRTLLTRDQTLDLPADSTAPLFALPLRDLFVAEHVVLVRLTMQDHTGHTISQNTYWLAASDPEYRSLERIPAATLTGSATTHAEGPESVIDLTLTNSASAPAIQTKATLLDASTGERILPAYFSDNYVTLLPGETAHIAIRVPANLSHSRESIALRGFNVQPSTVSILR